VDANPGKSQDPENADEGNGDRNIIPYRKGFLGLLWLSVTHGIVHLDGAIFVQMKTEYSALTDLPQSFNRGNLVVTPQDIGELVYAAPPRCQFTG
jgi:hypothetical protein